jgi:hypothetical protein
MLTKNWYAVWESHRAQQVIPSSLIDIDGNTKNSGCYDPYGIRCLCFSMKQVIFDNISCGIVLGSGTAPATINDYCLESRITADLVCSSVVTSDDNNDKVIIITATNSGDSNITIGEIGYHGSAPVSAQSSSSTAVLLERTVLDAPITITPGGVGQVAYKIKMSYPTA